MLRYFCCSVPVHIDRGEMNAVLYTIDAIKQCLPMSRISGWHLGVFIAAFFLMNIRHFFQVVMTKIAYSV